MYIASGVVWLGVAVITGISVDWFNIQRREDEKIVIIFYNSAHPFFAISVFASDKVVVIPVGGLNTDPNLTSNNIMKNKEIFGVVGTLMPRWGCDENLIFDSTRCEDECDNSTAHQDNPACNSICSVVGSFGHLYCRGQ